MKGWCNVVTFPVNSFGFSLAIQTRLVWAFNYTLIVIQHMLCFITYNLICIMYCKDLI